jgi:hypothetical protein
MWFNNKRRMLCLIVPLTLVFFGVDNGFGMEPAVNEPNMNGCYPLIRAEIALWGADQATLYTQEADHEDALYLTEAGKTEAGQEGVMSAECAAFAKDPNADLGAVLRAGCKPTLAQMSKLMDNPLGNVAMWFNQFDAYVLNNQEFRDERRLQWNYMGILQFPKGISKNWNIINRVVYNVTSAPVDQRKVDDLFDGDYGNHEGQPMPPSRTDVAPIDLIGGRTTGLGDTYYVGLFSPKAGIKHEGGGSSVWGVGLDAAFPTATDDVLGTGKWSAGPSALYAYLGPKWKVGSLLQHYWDYAGDDDRSDVNISNIQYFLYYSVTDTFSIGASPNIIANWEQDSDNTWTVPIGFGFNTTVNFGKVPVRWGAEVHYSVIRPDSIPGAEWDFRFFIIPAAPSALFEWMQ